MSFCCLAINDAHFHKRLDSRRQADIGSGVMSFLKGGGRRGKVGERQGDRVYDAIRGRVAAVEPASAAERACYDRRLCHLVQGATRT